MLLVKDIWILRPQKLSLCRCEMALKLSSTDLNFTKAMFFSRDCCKMCTLSTAPYSEKMDHNSFSWQMSLFIEDTCRVWDGGFMVIDLCGVNLNHKMSTCPKGNRSKHTSSIPLLLASTSLRVRCIL